MVTDAPQTCDPMHGGGLFEALSPGECFELLRRRPVGRVAISVGALPVVLPVNFKMHGDDVIFKTVSGSKLAAATAGAVVAFEVDDHEPSGESGWSVLVQGRAERMQEPAELIEVQGLGLESWALDGLAEHYVRIHADRVSGRRFAVTLR